MATRPSAHKRIKSDITGLLPPGLSPPSSTSPSISPCPTPPPWEDGAFEGEGGGVATIEDDQPSSSGSGVEIGGRDEGEMAFGGGGGMEEESSFIFPSIDVEVDITISVEYGTIKLQTEERYIDELYMLYACTTCTCMCMCMYVHQIFYRTVECV